MKNMYKHRNKILEDFNRYGKALSCKRSMYITLGCNDHKHIIISDGRITEESRRRWLKEIQDFHGRI